MKETDKNLLQEIAHLSHGGPPSSPNTTYRTDIIFMLVTGLIKKNEAKNHPKTNSHKKSKNFNRVNCDTFQSCGTSNQYKFSKPKPATEQTLSSSKNINRNAFPSASTTKSTSLLMNQTVIGVHQLSKLSSPSFMYINPKLLVPDSCRLINLSSKGQVENNHSCSIGQSHDPLDVQVHQNVSSLPTDSFKIESNQQQICHRVNRYKYLRAGRTKNDCTTSSNLAVAAKQEIKTASMENNCLKSNNNRFAYLSNNHTQTTSNVRVLSPREKIAKRSGSHELSSNFSFRKANNKNYSGISRNSYKLDRRVNTTPCASTLLNETSSPEHITSRKKYQNKIITRFSIKKSKFTTNIRPLKSACYVIKPAHSQSKIVKIQGTTYESKNKGKTLSRVRTSNSFSQTNARLDFHSVHRPVNKLASRVLKKSKTTLIKSRTKKNIFCKFYNLFGTCKRLKDGTCKFSHDQRQVFVCSKYVVGKCQNENCTMSHDLKGKIPTCRFFRKGLCSKKDCPFTHLLPRKVEKKKVSWKQKNIISLSNNNKKNKKEPIVATKSIIKTSLCSEEPSIVKKSVKINDGERRNMMKQNPDKNSLEVSTKSVEIDSRYYKLDPKRSPEKSVIPRRMPIDLIECIQDSDESDVSKESDNSEDFDSSCDSNNYSDEAEYKSESDLIERNDETKPVLVNSVENCSNVVVSQIVVGSNNENIGTHDETLNCTTNIGLSSVLIAPTDHTFHSSVTVKNSTTEKRQRLIGLQERFKQRVAIIRNSNDSLLGNITTAPHFDHTLH